VRNLLRARPELTALSVPFCSGLLKRSHGRRDVWPGRTFLHNPSSLRWDSALAYTLCRSRFPLWSFVAVSQGAAGAAPETWAHKTASLLFAPRTFLTRPLLGAVFSKKSSPFLARGIFLSTHPPVENRFQVVELWNDARPMLLPRS